MKRWYNIFLISKFFSTISATISYLKVKRKISDFFYGEGFRVLIKQYLNVDLRKDWIGRLYGVANPYLNKDGKLFIVIRKEQGAKSLIIDLKKYYDVIVLNRKKGFYILRCVVNK